DLECAGGAKRRRRFGSDRRPPTKLGTEGTSKAPSLPAHSKLIMTFDPVIQRFDSIDSTNLEAMRQAKAGAPEGLCIVARTQTRGRGRLDRTWQSPPGAGLYMSLLLRPEFAMTAWRSEE